MRPETKLYLREVSEAGRVRYIEHSTVGAFDGLPPGDYLVSVRPGVKSISRVLDAQAKVPEVLAVLHRVREAMADALLERMKLNPTSRDNTPVEIAAWGEYLACLARHGQPHPVSLAFEGVSPSDVIDAGIAVLERAISEAQK